MEASQYVHGTRPRLSRKADDEGSCCLNFAESCIPPLNSLPGCPQLAFLLYSSSRSKSLHFGSRYGDATHFSFCRKEHTWTRDNGAGQKDTCPPPLKARTSPLHGDARVSGSLSVAFSFLGSLMTLRVLACLLWLG